MLKHIAFIMDGNGRWAKEKGKNRSFGHRVGFENLIDIIDACVDLEIKEASFYCFSTENWDRPKLEVDYLMSIPEEIYKNEDFKDLVSKGVKVNICGNKKDLPKKTLEYCDKIEKDSYEGNKLKCNLLFNYGSIEEIRSMVEKLSGLNIEINLETIKRNLQVPSMVDLMIRTGKEKRLSNFLLLQLAYSELYFSDTYWPDFNKEELEMIINDFNKRNRTFGKVKE